MPQQGQLWAQRAKAAAGPRPLPSPLVLPQHCPLLGQDGQEASRETSPEPCSRTQDLGENYALSPLLDTGPCGLPQCAKSSGERSVSDRRPSWQHDLLTNCSLHAAQMLRSSKAEQPRSASVLCRSQKAKNEAAEHQAFVYSEENCKNAHSQAQSAACALASWRTHRCPSFLQQKLFQISSAENSSSYLLFSRLPCTTVVSE